MTQRFRCSPSASGRLNKLTVNGRSSGDREGAYHTALADFFCFKHFTWNYFLNFLAMVQAGPSNGKKQKKTRPQNAVRSSKLKKVAAVKSIEALEESAMQYVSAFAGVCVLVRAH